MNISVKLDGVQDLLDTLNQFTDGSRMERALAAAGEVVRADAAANAPVDTGRLRGSIVCKVEGNDALVGPTASYGSFVEFGTGGAKGDPSVAHTTKKTWVYKKGDRYYRTSGQAPQPYLVPALKNNVSAIAAKFREVFTNG